MQNHSDSTNRLFEQNKATLNGIMDEIIANVEAKYPQTLIDSTRFNIGTNSQQQEIFSRFAERLVSPILKLRNELLMQVQVSVIQEEASRINIQHRELVIEEEKISVAAWATEFDLTGSLEELREKLGSPENIVKKKNMDPAKHRQTVTEIRNGRASLMQDSSIFENSVKENITTTAGTESRRMLVKITRELQQAMSTKKEKLCTVQQAIIQGAFASFTKMIPNILNHDDVANDILDTTMKLIDPGTPPSPDMQPSSTEQETILEERIQFYKYRHWCNYQMDSALEHAYRERVTGPGTVFTDYSVRMLIQKITVSMERRNVRIRMPAEYSDLPNGPSRDVPGSGSRGSKESDADDVQRTHEIELELRQALSSPRMSPGPEYGCMNTQRNQRPEPTGSRSDTAIAEPAQPPLFGFHSKLTPVIERLVNSLALNL